MNSTSNTGGSSALPEPMTQPDAKPPSDTAAPPADTGSGAGTETPPPVTGDGDEAPARPLNIDMASSQSYSFSFTPKQADPAANRRNETQTAMVDTRRAPLRGKLVIALSGVGSPPGPNGVVSYAAGLGFHAMSLAYENSSNPSTQSDPKFFGEMRAEQFDGTDHVGAITVTRPDCVEVRVAKAMAYLQEKNPQADWAYFLKPDMTVRWSDVIFIGHSHGATSAAYYGRIRRIWRAISLSGPRDTNPVSASWLAMPSLTPLDRFYGFTGTGDDQHQDHIKAMELLKYPGSLVDTGSAAPPYNNSRRLRYGGGHNDSTNCSQYNAVCRYMLGVQ